MMSRYACLALLLASPAPAWADCTVAAVNLAFGPYYPFAPAPLDFNGSVTVTCAASSGALPLQIALNVGSITGGGASYAERTMAKGADYLGFNLYKDGARSVVWGDGTAGSQTVTAPASLATDGGTATFAVYGRVRVGQRRYDPPGNYASTITVTLSY